ncbi:MAG TPA: hypothetical protein VKT78_18625, partial [Fimbriimonadaceae bacterium]|nr:hypothetical protein [Fimbriimonadaceae bacterium]
EIRAAFPAKPKLASEAPYRQSALLSAARGASFEKLSRCFALVSDADARLKGMLPAFSAMETLESAVLGMTALFGTR